MALIKATQNVIAVKIATLDTEQTISGSKTFSLPINGNLIGNVTGNVSGNVTGNVTGNVIGNSSTSTVAASCSGNSATATTAAACSGNSATATTAAACSGNSATATTAATCSGNSATATKLITARSINGVAFDGTSNIIIPPYSAFCFIDTTTFTTYTGTYQNPDGGTYIQVTTPTPHGFISNVETNLKPSAYFNFTSGTATDGWKEIIVIDEYNFYISDSTYTIKSGNVEYKKSDTSGTNIANVTEHTSINGIYCVNFSKIIDSGFPSASVMCSGSTAAIPVFYDSDNVFVASNSSVILRTILPSTSAATIVKQIYFWIF